MSTLTPETFWAETRSGLATTRILLALRWRMIRRPWARAFILLGAFFGVWSLITSIHLGYLVRIAATEMTSVSGTYAQAWLTLLGAGAYTQIGAMALGGALLVALFAPFTGTSTLALVPADDLGGVRPGRAHRYFDALAINAVSGLGLLQLLTLTGLTSLLVLDGWPLPAMVFTWAVWALMLTLTTTVGWVLEWVIRRWGKGRRRLLGLTLIAALVVALAVDPNRGKTLFGLADGYTTLLRTAAGGQHALGFTAAGVTALVAALVLLAGVLSTIRALELPPPAEQASRTHKYRPVGASGDVIAMRLVSRVLWRTPEVRRPALAIALFGVPAVLAVPMDQTVVTTLSVAVPLTAALAWGVNAFAVLGPGLSWLGSQPKVTAHLLRASTSVQYLVTVGLLATLGLTAWTVGRADLVTVGGLLLEGGTSAALVTAASASLSVHKAMRAPLQGRGDALVPPLTALAYLARLAVLAMLPSLAISADLGPERTAWAFSALWALVGLFLARAFFSWSRPKVRARVISAVSPT